MMSYWVRIVAVKERQITVILDFCSTINKIWLTTQSYQSTMISILSECYVNGH